MGAERMRVNPAVEVYGSVKTSVDAVGSKPAIHHGWARGEVLIPGHGKGAV